MYCSIKPRNTFSKQITIDVQPGAALAAWLPPMMCQGNWFAFDLSLVTSVALPGTVASIGKQPDDDDPRITRTQGPFRPEHSLGVIMP